MVVTRLQSESGIKMHKDRGSGMGSEEGGGAKFATIIL